MPGPLSPDALKAYADPAYLSRQAPAAPTSGPNWMHRAGLPAMAGGTAADLFSTLAVLGQGGREQNPLYGEHPSGGKLAALSALTTVPTALLLDRAYDKAAPGSTTRKAALITALALGGLTGGIAARNLKALK